MRIDYLSFLQAKPGRVVCMLAMLFLTWVLLPGANSAAQGVPPFVVTTQTTLASNTYPPPVGGNPLLQGAGFGTLAVNKFGDLFIGAYNSNVVYEFPASGTGPIAVYISSTGGHGGAVAVDANQNLYVTERYGDFVYMIPYFNGTYQPYSYSSSVTPPNCTSATPTSGAACNYDAGFLTYENSISGSVTGYYYQPSAIAFDPLGNSYMASASDNNGSQNIYMCSVACNFAGANDASQLIHWNNAVLSIAADAAGNVYFADSSNSVYVIAAGSTTATPVASVFNRVQGVTLDQNGNLFVADFGAAPALGSDGKYSIVGAGVFEIPMEGGALNPAHTFLVFPLNFWESTTKSGLAGYSSPLNIGTIGVAVDQHGNIFATEGYNNLFKYTVGNAQLPLTELGSTSDPATALTLSFSKAVTLASSTVTVAGVTPALSEFSIVTGTGAGTCVTGTAYAAGQTCTINIQFTPILPGLRTAILTLTDTNSEAVQVALSGTGLGQAITVDPGTQTAIGSGLGAPQAAAVDGAGNVFVADGSANKVYEFAQGAGAGVSVGSGLKAPGGVAVDAAGNLYISDTGNGRVVMVPNSGGALQTSLQSTLLTGLSGPSQLAVDANGTLYIPESGNNDVVTFVSRGGLAGASVTTVPVTGLKAPAAVTVDAKDNIYVTDTGNNRVVEYSDGNISATVEGLGGPTGVAIDGSGSLIIADNGNGRIVRVPAESGVLAQSDQTTVNTSILSPYAVQLDAIGNLIATDKANHAAYSINRTVGSIAFGKVNDDSSSVGETAVLASSGTADLPLNSPLYPPLDTTVPFAVTTGTQLGCAGVTNLPVGTSCTLEAYFTPIIGDNGDLQYSVAFSTGAQNTASPSLTLSGTAVNEIPVTVSLVQTAPAGGAASYGQSVTIQATVAPVTPIEGQTPSGTVTLIVDGNDGQPQTLNASGTASITLTGLTGGNHLIAAKYSGDALFAPGATTGTITVVIQPDASSTTLAIVGYAVNPITAEPANATHTGDTVTMTATVVPAFPGALSGTVVFSAGGTTIGSAPVTGATSGSTTIYTAVLSTTFAQAGTYNVVATYSGNANYFTSASSPTAVLITPPTFALTMGASSITSSAKSPGSTSVTVTSWSGFVGAVDFSCSGLPAHATCHFVPAVLALTATGATPIVIPPLTNQLTVLVDQAPVVTPTAIPWWSGLLLGVLLFAFAGARNARRRLLMQCAAVVVLLASLTGLSACGGKTSFPTPNGTSTITLTATASTATFSGTTVIPVSATQSITFTLTAQ